MKMTVVSYVLNYFVNLTTLQLVQTPTRMMKNVFLHLPIHHYCTRQSNMEAWT